MDHTESKELPSKVFTGIFGGSAPYPYQTTDHLEAGIGSSLFHAITRMPQYQHFSIEELRLEDYNASGGIFGAKIMKLANAMCNPPQRTPFYYGKRVGEAIRSITDTPPAVQGENVDKMENPSQKPNVTLPGNYQNVTVVVKSGSVVNLSFSGNVHLLTILSGDEKKPPSVESKYRSKSRGRSKSHRNRSNHGKSNADNSKENIRKNKRNASG